ncbi:MAG: WbqC family protein [Selenomonadaceae bacterium]|nr:WbqC family protein [Selenomonadaceae bacterium]
MKKVAVLQSNYIPWKGYFDIIHDVDEFIFYDEVQFTKNDWRNRNKIITKQGEIWLTVPVGMNKIHRLILDVQMKDSSWQKKHFATLEMAYHKAPYFKHYEEFLKFVYLEKTWTYLYELNRFLIENISRQFLGITTKFSDSRDYPTHGAKHEKLLSLVKAAQADVYVSGPAAKDYIIAEDYAREGIELVWKDYSGYPEYPQRNENFTHNVSILDLLFNVGDDAPYYIWAYKKRGGGSSLL